MAVRLTVIAVITAVICMRTIRGGWSKKQMRSDAFATLALIGICVVAVRLAGG